jgi:hypothetical protein
LRESAHEHRLDIKMKRGSIAKSHESKQKLFRCSWKWIVARQRTACTLLSLQLANFPKNIFWEHLGIKKYPSENSINFFNIFLTGNWKILLFELFNFYAETISTLGTVYTQNLRMNGQNIIFKISRCVTLKCILPNSTS